MSGLDSWPIGPIADALGLSPFGLVVAVFLAIIVGGGAFRWYRLRPVVADLERDGLPTAGDVGTATGTVVALSDETTQPPTAGSDAVCHGWRIEEYRDTTDVQEWVPTAAGVVGSRFAVEGDGRRVEVDVGSHATEGPIDSGTDSAHLLTTDTTFSDGAGVVTDGAVLDAAAYDETIEWGSSEDPPRAVQEFEEGVAGFEDFPVPTVAVGSRDGRQRYRSVVVRPGDEVVVRGEVASDGQTLVPPSSAELFLSTRGPEEVLSTLRKRYRWPAAAATVALVALVALFVV